MINLFLAIAESRMLKKELTSKQISSNKLTKDRKKYITSYLMYCKTKTY